MWGKSVARLSFGQGFTQLFPQKVRNPALNLVVILNVEKPT